MLTPAGKKFTQREAERLAKYDQLILLCGRYEGFDARVTQHEIDHLDGILFTDKARDITRSS